MCYSRLVLRNAHDLDAPTLPPALVELILPALIEHILTALIAQIVIALIEHASATVTEWQLPMNTYQLQQRCISC